MYINISPSKEPIGSGKEKTKPKSDTPMTVSRQAARLSYCLDKLARKALAIQDYQSKPRNIQ